MEVCGGEASTGEAPETLYCRVSFCAEYQIEYPDPELSPSVEDDFTREAPTEDHSLSWRKSPCLAYCVERTYARSLPSEYCCRASPQPAVPWPRRPIPATWARRCGRQ